MKWSVGQKPYVWKALSRFVLATFVSSFCVSSTHAGPPYVTDDPQPTDLGNFEIYAFSSGARARDGLGGAGGIDFNYGAATDLQLTAVLPVAWDNPDVGSRAVNLGRIELAAKYKFLHQDDVGFDVAIFPRVFLSAGSGRVGERHASLLLPLWVGRSWGSWSSFGGGGCVLNHGDGSKNFCQFGWTLTNQITSNLQIGAELYHQTPDLTHGRASTGASLGAIYDLTENIHLLASAGPGLQNADEADRVYWYSAILFTF